MRVGRSQEETAFEASRVEGCGAANAALPIEILRNNATLPKQPRGQFMPFVGMVVLGACACAHSQLFMGALIGVAISTRSIAQLAGNSKFRGGIRARGGFLIRGIKFSA
jgi:hypothetical protein